MQGASHGSLLPPSRDEECPTPSQAVARTCRYCREVEKRSGTETEKMFLDVWGMYSKRPRAKIEKGVFEKDY